MLIDFCLPISPFLINKVKKKSLNPAITISWIQSEIIPTDKILVQQFVFISHIVDGKTDNYKSKCALSVSVC